MGTLIGSDRYAKAADIDLQLLDHGTSTDPSNDPTDGNEEPAAAAQASTPADRAASDGAMSINPVKAKYDAMPTPLPVTSVSITARRVARSGSLSSRRASISMPYRMPIQPAAIGDDKQGRVFQGLRSPQSQRQPRQPEPMPSTE